MTCYQPLAFPREVDERRHERHEVELGGRARELGSVAVTGAIRDVSIGGCRLKDVDFDRNAELWVSLGAAPPRRARVVWMRSGEAGCEFYAPLSRAELRNVMLGRQN